MLAPLLPFLAAGGMGGAGALGGLLVNKIGRKVGLRKGGSFHPKGVSRALNNATVKKTGMRMVRKTQLVIPKNVAKKLNK